MKNFKNINSILKRKEGSKSMVKALHKDAIKEIVNTRKKIFIYIANSIIRSRLFAGIRATSPDMKKQQTHILMKPK